MAHGASVLHKLGEVGEVFCSIANALKTAKKLRDRTGEVSRITEETRKHALEISKVKFQNDPLLQELKAVFEKLPETCSHLETCLQSFSKQTDLLEEFEREKLRGFSSIPDDVMAEFSCILETSHETASNFSEAFKTFSAQLRNATGLVDSLVASLKRRAETMEAKTTFREVVRSLLGGAALAPLGFFSRQSDLVATGTAAIRSGINASLSRGEVRKLAFDIHQMADKLNFLAKGMKRNCDKAEAKALNLGPEMLEHLKPAVAFIRRDQANVAVIEANVAVIEAKDAEIEAKDAEIEAKNAEIKAKDAEIEALKTEVSRLYAK